MNSDMKAIIVDIDGTLADVRSIAHICTELQDLDLYHEKSVDVPVVDWVLSDIEKALDRGDAIFLVTARKEKYLYQTMQFLIKNKVRFTSIFMRKNDDTSNDVDYKKSVLNSIRDLGYHVTTAYEDNPEIAELWMACGIRTVIVKERGFNHDYESWDQ